MYSYILYKCYTNECRFHNKWPRLPAELAAHIFVEQQFVLFVMSISPGHAQNVSW